MTRVTVWGLLCVTLIGCTGIGFIATSNPYRKLAQASELLRQDRALLAELVIGDSLEIFKRKGDELGMAEAYHAYGNLYKHYSYHGEWAATFKKYGTYDGTYMKSITHFEKSKGYFERNGKELGVIKCLFGIGNAYELRGNREKACTYYNEALSRYRAGEKQGTITPEPIIHNRQYKDPGELIESFMKSSCG